MRRPRSGRCRASAFCARLAAALAWLFAMAPAAAPGEPAANDAFRQLASYRFGQSRAALDAVARLVRESHADPAERRRLEDRLVALLGSEATQEAKAFACRQLAVAGSARSVGALAGLLGDEGLSSMARYALERIPGPEATAALRDALGRLSGPARLGAVNSLGERKDPSAAAALARLLSDPDKAVACAAAAALGRIGGSEAVHALARALKGPEPAVRAAAAHASLECAETFLARSRPSEAAGLYQELWAGNFGGLVRGSALRGLLAAKGREALPLVTEALGSDDPELRAAAALAARETQIPGAAEVLASRLPSLKPPVQALLVAALAGRGDPGARG